MLFRTKLVPACGVKVWEAEGGAALSLAKRDPAAVAAAAT